MHAIDLAELASTFVTSANSITLVKASFRTNGMNSLWLAHRFRFENWMDRISTHRAELQNPSASSRRRQWNSLIPLLEEILLAEPLVRCLAYQASVHEHLGLDEELIPLCTSMLTTQREARHRCLHLIVFGQAMPVESAVHLNRLRRNLEYYTDHLLALMQPIPRIDNFAFDSICVDQRQTEL